MSFNSQGDEMVTHKKITMNDYWELSKKWAVPVLKELFLGSKHFSDFLEFHPELSNRVLSDQLKHLEKHGYIKKEVVSKTPLKIEYSLTDLGKDLNKYLYENLQFAIRHGLLGENDPYLRGKNLEDVFGIDK